MLCGYDCVLFDSEKILIDLSFAYLQYVSNAQIDTSTNVTAIISIETQYTTISRSVVLLFPAEKN